VRKLAVDFEHPSRTWWESGGRALWEALAGAADEASVVVDDDVAASWLAQASAIPGWNAGPEWAPHPIAARVVEADDEL
jgi:hypothetical protein